MILMAARFSGVAAFLELVDARAVRSLSDPLRARVEELLDGGEPPASAS
jgi:hypothetical protein